jgi:hypothetical protein
MKNKKKKYKNGELITIIMPVMLTLYLLAALIVMTLSIMNNDVIGGMLSVWIAFGAGWLIRFKRYIDVNNPELYTDPPLKIGSTVYFVDTESIYKVNKPLECKIYGISIYEKDLTFLVEIQEGSWKGCQVRCNMEHFGNRVFTSYLEASKAFSEL